FPEQKAKEVDEMDSVRESHPGVHSGPFEAAEIRPQHLDLAEPALRNRLFHPNRCRIEPENVADLHNQSGPFCEFDKFPGIGRLGSDRLFDEHVFTGLEQAAANFKMALGPRNYYCRIDDRKKRTRVRPAMALRN